MTKRSFAAIVAFAYISVLSFASPKDRTLRLDYIFSGTCNTSSISFAGASCFDGWYGRRVNTDTLLLQGNGQVQMCDEATGKVLYVTSFSTLFQEWQNSEEATRVTRSYEHVALLPMPDSPVVVTVTLRDGHAEVLASLSHRIDPKDILIQHKKKAGYETKYVWKGGDPKDCIDIVILAEGYTASQMRTFFADAERAAQAIFYYEPFKSLKAKFNVLAVASVSEDSGVSEPSRHVWRKTAVGSHFDTFYTDRYLTTSEVRRMHDCLSGLPYEHILILANTARYGGGGIYNSYHISAAHHHTFREVFVHEFGHSFAGLGDEYYYDDQYSDFYFSDTEPWEPNLTTKCDFASKWQDLMEQGVEGVGLFEGGGYTSKGVWRPADDCRMKTNACPDFCPVCQRAITRMVEYHTEPLKN